MLRIIAGSLKRRNLVTPPDNAVTRPMPDRIKQSLFDRLWSLGLLGSGQVLDIFSGVGTLGIEALSRGADRCIFVERDKKIRNLLEKNLKTLGLRQQSQVLSVDVLATNWAAHMQKGGFRLIFCDPPYPMVLDEQTRPQILGMLSELANLAEPGGLLMYRTPVDAEIVKIDGWLDPWAYDYGSMTTHLYPHDDEVWHAFEEMDDEEVIAEVEAMEAGDDDEPGDDSGDDDASQTA